MHVSRAQVRSTVSQEERRLENGPQRTRERNKKQPGSKERYIEEKRLKGGEEWIQGKVLGKEKVYE